MQTKEPQPQEGSKKLKQYMDELNKLNEKYQYRPVARLVMGKGGIIPYLGVEEIVPKVGPQKVTKKK